VAVVKEVRARRTISTTTESNQLSTSKCACAHPMTAQPGDPTRRYRKTTMHLNDTDIRWKLAINRGNTG
jgi:hypothetical protein